LHDRYIYNINDIKNPTVHQNKSKPSNKWLKAFTEVYNKIKSTSNQQEVNISCKEKENETSRRKCSLCHKIGHYTSKCPNKKNANINN
jgi:hypothetical protein